MSDFDPYHQWLGIPETARPISKYRLLGIDDFESDRGVISREAVNYHSFENNPFGSQINAA